MFYDELSNCFMKTSVNKSVYDLVSDKFFIVIPEEDRTRLDQLYGVTPTRVTEETTGESETTSPEPSS